MRKLDVVSPVPADIDIANSVQPIHIDEIAKNLNLTPNHYDLYGKYKAKVIQFRSYLFLNLYSIAYVIGFVKSDLICVCVGSVVCFG